jgi:hypothetical protein
MKGCVSVCWEQSEVVKAVKYSVGSESQYQYIKHTVHHTVAIIMENKCNAHTRTRTEVANTQKYTDC